MKVTVRPETPGDFDAIDRVVAEAFGPPAEAELVRKIRASTSYRPASSLVAVVDEQVVGHVMISTACVVGDNRRREVAMLSPLAVEPDRQRLGLGDRLVRAACAVADDAGEQMVVLQGDPRYYSRFGFEASVSLGITMDLPDWAPVEAGQALRLAAWDGTLSGHVELSDAFDGLD